MIKLRINSLIFNPIAVWQDLVIDNITTLQYNIILIFFCIEMNGCHRSASSRHRTKSRSAQFYLPIVELQQWQYTGDLFAVLYWESSEQKFWISKPFLSMCVRVFYQFGGFWDWYVWQFTVLFFAVLWQAVLCVFWFILRFWIVIFLMLHLRKCLS